MARTKDGGAIVRVSSRQASIAYDGASLDDWSDDELLEGRKKNKNGHFIGRPPKWLPVQLHRELTRRRLGRAQALLAHSVVDAVKLLRAVVNDAEADTSTRLKSAEMILDRVMGKPKESIDITADIPAWQRLAAEAIRSLDDLKHHDGIVPSLPTDDDPSIIDGEIVETTPPADPERATEPAELTIDDVLDEDEA